MQFKLLLTFIFLVLLFNKAFPLELDSLLTKEEISWLNKNRHNITFSSDPYWPPVDFVDENGKPKGIVADYVKVFEEELNVDFKFKEYTSWYELLSSLKKSEVDFVGSVNKSVDRSQHLLFTESYLELPLVILVREDYPPFQSIEHINKMKLSAVGGYSSMDYVAENYPSADIIAFDSDLTALLQTSFGHTDGTIVDLASASYLIGKYKINNLTIGVDLDYSWNICFATSKDQATLISIFDKLLKNIEPQRKAAIYNKWINIQKNKHNFLEENQEIIIAIGIALLAIIFSIVLYNRRLKKEVIRKTSDMENEVKKKNEALQELKKSEKNYKSLFDYGALPKWIYDIETYKIVRVNQTAIDHYGYSEEEFLKLTIKDIRPKNEIEKLLDVNRKVSHVGSTHYYGIWKHLKKNGEVIDVEVFGYVMEFRGRKCKTISCIDVTQRLKDERMLKDFAENLEKKVEIRTEELFEAHGILKEQHQEITDSINYAKKIQYAIFPKIKEFKNIFRSSFVFFRPKDVVSGDFYWCHSMDNYRFAVVGDCTGHGVPGALLTMIGNQLLKQTIFLKNILDPALILKEMDTEIGKLMNYESNSTRDGMDIAICRIDESKGEVIYSGARMSLFHGSKNGLKEIKPSKSSIGGGVLNPVANSYFNHSFPIEEGDTIYMSTDGYFDQFGGDKDKKLSKRRFMELIDEVKHLPIRVQCSKSVGFFKKWKGSKESTDDVLLVGIKL